jgi:UDP-glucose 4-epimerase
LKVLITGVAGKLGRRVGELLRSRGHEVCGIDRRPWPDAPSDIQLYRHDIRKRAAEEVFRSVRPEVVVHMATVTHLTLRSEDRYRINLQGTRAVFDHCKHYGARRCVFVGRHTYYGAAHDSPLYHREDDPPMAATSFPELADLVAADLYAGSALWRYPELGTAVLRVCYTLGPSHHGTLASYLAAPRVPTILGFDPLFQFMHEDDVAAAIGLTATSELRGVFNVAGPRPIPLSVIIHAAGKRRLPLPEPVFSLALPRFGLPGLPRGALTHLKYPVVIDDSAFRSASGFAHSYDEHQTIAAFRDRFASAA